MAKRRGVCAAALLLLAGTHGDSAAGQSDESRRNVAASLPRPLPPPNMNGEYVLSRTPGAKSTARKFPAQYADYPGGASYFDVYSSTISTLYSQVFWKGFPPMPLPQDVVRRFDGKGMAIVGFEVDQVRRTQSGEVSVPYAAAYNHHFEGTVVGKHARFRSVSPSAHGDPRIAHRASMGHGVPAGEHWQVADLGTSDGTLPVSQEIGAANGGEARKSFHGYAPGFAQVIDSPTQMQITPMQIDTWHREKMSLSQPTRFVPGPVPRSSLAPSDGPDATYSGLLECPVTTRLRKEADSSCTAQIRGTCSRDFAEESQCLAAAKSFFGSSKVDVVLRPAAGSHQPLGCSAMAPFGGARAIEVYFRRDGAPVQCAAGATKVRGIAASLVNVSLDLDLATEVAQITIVGPGDVWFGVGFNARRMGDAPWAIIVDAYGNVSERKLHDQSPGKELPPSVRVVASSLVEGERTVVLSRPFRGPSPDHFTFGLTDNAEMSFINAVGSEPTLSYHKNKSPSSMTLLPVATNEQVAGTCLCVGAPKPFGTCRGSLVYQQTSQKEDVGNGASSFWNACPRRPEGDLLAQRNPTCDIRTYSGGQLACHHMWSLLDADQEIPWPDQPLEYRMKFRFWVQEYNASYHRHVYRDTWGIASPVEYDVPRCAAGIPGCTWDKRMGWVHTISGTFTPRTRGLLVAAHFHCHAPTCLSVSLYKCGANVTVCNVSTGELLCREDALVGGAGRVPEARFDEPGFIAVPPCLWGSEEFGLAPPPDFSGATLGAVKTANATYGHHGEMAWLQVFYVDPIAAPDFLV